MTRLGRERQPLNKAVPRRTADRIGIESLRVREHVRIGELGVVVISVNK